MSRRSFLTSSMPPTTSKPCCGLDELDEAEALALDDLALARRDQLVHFGAARRVAHGGRDQRRDLDRLQPGRPVSVPVRVAAGKVGVRQHRGRPPGRAVGHRDLDDGHLGVRQELRREVCQVLSHEEHHVVALLDLGQKRPAVKSDERGAVRSRPGTRDRPWARGRDRRCDSLTRLFTPFPSGGGLGWGHLGTLGRRLEQRVELLRRRRAASGACRRRCVACAPSARPSATAAAGAH